MTQWVYVSSGSRQSNAGAASLTPALPTIGSRTGGMYIAMATANSNATLATATSGWTARDQRNSGASFTGRFFTAPVGSAAPVITGTTMTSAQVVYIEHPTEIIDFVNLGVVNGSDGLTATHTSTGYNTTGFDSLATYIDLSAANTRLGTPSGWTEDLDGGSATGPSGNVFGHKIMGASGSATGNISVTGANSAWVQWQVEILLVPPPTGLSITSLESVPWIGTTDGLSTATLEIVPWIRSVTGLEIGMMEIVPWIKTISSAVVRRRKLYIN
jgi:hypothetical protein